MQKEIPKHYDHTTYEKQIYDRWIAADAFSAVPDERDQTYVIMMPLPNVTGALHMGHAMDNVMQDLLIRWHRMLHENALWMPGTDHAGIATQAVVEKRLYELEGKTRHDIGRDALVTKIWTWKDEYQQRIIQQQQRMGCSCDWKRQRFTMDEVCARAVREAFFRLFRDRLIYRGDRLVNWDCQLQTAVSDDEIVYEKIQGHFWHIRYPVISPKPGEPEFVVVATTRPETMLGDTAVACHPDPESALNSQIQLLSSRLESAPKKEKPAIETALTQARERKENLLPHLIQLKHMAEQGRTVKLPLLGREMPIILDEWAKPELGSGCVKITPGHDPNDYEVWKRHHKTISIINILNPDGTLNDNAGPYSGLDRFAAREKILVDLNMQSLMDSIEDREIEIGHSDRSKTPIEPYLSKQWFIDMGDQKEGILCGAGTDKQFKAPGLAQAAIDAVDQGYKSPSGLHLTFYPDHNRYGGTYQSWLGEKRDWCISRQLWWGHRIPIWHGNFTLEALKTAVSSLPEFDSEKLFDWIADSDGRLYHRKEISKLKSDVRFDYLVCLRSPESEETYAGILEKAGLRQDPDVLDTWFSSALWPFSTLGWPDPESAITDPGQRPLGAVNTDKNSLQYYYPGSCLVTGRDIITLWVARMMIMGLYLLGDVPFTACFVHANIQDGKGERMSKSKGNGIDPEDIIEKYGADAMRYILCDMQTGTQDIRLPVQAVSPYSGELVDLAKAKHGRTIFTYICPQSGKEFDVLGTMPDLPMAKIISERFEVGRAFCTKLWNAARFALMNLGEHEYFPVSTDQLFPEDQWILSRISQVTTTVTEHLKAYNPSAAITAARDFFWSELCDWYLEFIKLRLKEPDSAQIARSVLATALDHVLRLFHPFVPYITEVLWEGLNAQCPSRGLDLPLPSSNLLINAQWPVSKPDWINPVLEEEFELIQSAIHSVRELRARHNISPSKKLDGKIKADRTACKILKSMDRLIRHMGGLGTLEIGPDVDKPATAATQVAGHLEIHLAGIIDPKKEKTQLNSKREKLLKELERAEMRLNNENFLAKAPPQVVAAEKMKLQAIRAQIDAVNQNLEALKSSSDQSS